jgi:hypothetical protein
MFTFCILASILVLIFVVFGFKAYNIFTLLFQKVSRVLIRVFQNHLKNILPIRN